MLCGYGENHQDSTWWWEALAQIMFHKGMKLAKVLVEGGSWSQSQGLAGPLPEATAVGLISPAFMALCKIP